MKQILQKRHKVMTKKPKIIEVCHASHFKKLWFCPFTRIWHRFKTTLRMCPTFSFCAVSVTFPCSSSFQWQIFAQRIRFLARANSARFVFEKKCRQNRNPVSGSKTSFLDGCCHESYTKKGWPANLDSKINMKFLTFQSSLRETHEI